MRGRTTLVATAVVAAALVVGSIGLVALLRTSLTEGVENTVSAQMTNVASLLRLGPLPATLPAGHTDTFTQVVGPTGEVLATTSTLEGDEPVTTADPGEEGIVLRHVPGLNDREPGEALEGPFLVAARSVPATLPGQSGTQTVTVYVGASLRAVERGTHSVSLALFGGVPVLAVLVGILVWIITGRALRPVEAIRAEVADITGHDLHRRVPEPTSGDEVARLARQMNEMLDRLESSAAGQRRFVADASHELRSPLATLQATLEVALAHPEGTAWSATAAEALEEVRQLHQLVEDLLVLARVEETGRAETSTPVDLDEIVLRDGRQRRRDAQAVTLDLRRVSGGRVRGDAAQLTRVVRNLVDNAQRHAASKVAVEVRTIDGEVELVVSDDGPGIPLENREQIFERFARLDESRSHNGGGTGLGLAIVDEIVRAHHGSVTVDGGGPGARFVVRLPADEED